MLSIKNLRFINDKPILKRSLDISRQVHAIMGPNGAGKNTVACCPASRLPVTTAA